MRNWLFVLGIFGWLTGGSRAADVDFAHQIVPIFKQYCAECHTGEKKKGGLSLNTRETLLAGGENGPGLVVGKAASSEIIKRILSRDEDLQMPPKGPRVPAEKVALLKAWIDQGAKWEPGYTLAKRTYTPPLKPRRPDVPTAVPGREHPVDRFLDAHLARIRSPLPSRVDDATFYRRLSLDLHGRLPTLMDLDSFLADSQPDKRDRLVRKLLADDVSYAEHWLSFWNDLLRNDYSGTGYIDGGRKQITLWLYQSLLINKPYDQFVRELAAPTAESAGFAHGIRWRGNVNASQVIEMQFAQSVAQVFLGINLKCASCHDSFIDRWKLDEAYSLAAVFAKQPLEIHRCDKGTGKQAQAAWMFPELGQIDPTAPQPKRLEQLAGLLTHPENGRLARTIVNRLWQRLMGHGLVEPVDSMEVEPWNADLLDWLAVDLAEHKYDLKHTLARITTSAAYQSQTARVTRPDAPYVYAGPRPKRLTAEQFLDCVWQVTGTGPTKPHAPITRPKTDTPLPPRAGLMRADLLQRALGRPNREQIVSIRPSDLTTLEAIDLANHPQLAEILEKGATQLLRQQSDPNKLIPTLYRQAFCRQPTSAEFAAARDLLGDKPSESAMQDLLWAVFMSPEFQFVR